MTFSRKPKVTPSMLVQAVKDIFAGFNIGVEVSMRGGQQIEVSLSKLHADAISDGNFNNLTSYIIHSMNEMSYGRYIFSVSKLTESADLGIYIVNIFIERRRENEVFGQDAGDQPALP